MNRLLLVFLLLCLPCESLVSAQDENLLDIVKVRQLQQGNKKASKKSKAEDKPKFVSPRPTSATMTHMPPTPKSLEITLLSLDKQGYRMGENCIYEIRLENITNGPIIIPWSVDSEDERPDRDPPGYVKARVNLLIIDGQSKKPIDGVSIAGSNLARGSLKTLKPKESVRIRVPARFAPANFTDEQEMIAKLPRTFEVRAYYEILELKVNWRPENSLSANSLIIGLTK